MSSLDKQVEFVAIRAAKYAGVGMDGHQFDGRFAACSAWLSLVGFRTPSVLALPAALVDHWLATFWTVHIALLPIEDYFARRVLVDFRNQSRTALSTGVRRTPSGDFCESAGRRKVLARVPSIYESIRAE